MNIVLSCQREISLVKGPILVPLRNVLAIAIRVETNGMCNSTRTSSLGSNRQIAESTMINKFDILTSLCNDCNSLDCDEHIHTDPTKTTEYYIHNPFLSVKEISDISDSVIVDNEASKTISDTQLTDTSSSTNSEHPENTNLADTSSI